MLLRSTDRYLAARSSGYLVEHNPDHRNDHEAEHAAFRSHRSSTQPLWAAQRRTQQVTGRDHPTVRHGIEEGLSPIPRGMKTDGEPEIARSPQSQAEEQSNECRGQQAGPLLTFISAGESARSDTKDQCGGPEADAASERELRVAAQQKFLEQVRPAETSAAQKAAKRAERTPCRTT